MEDERVWARREKGKTRERKKGSEGDSEEKQVTREEGRAGQSQGYAERQNGGNVG